MSLALLLDAVVLVVALALLSFVGLAVRGRALTRGGGTFECALRMRPRGVPTGWVPGVARYAGDRIEWFPMFSLSFRPRRVLRRRELRPGRRRRPGRAEAVAVAPGAVVLEILDSTRAMELAMSENALTGFLAWLEAAPPGQHLDVA